MVTVMICGMNQQKHARRRKLTLATDATQPEVRSASHWHWQLELDYVKNAL